jgi:hypothetical protein
VENSYGTGSGCQKCPPGRTKAAGDHPEDDNYVRSCQILKTPPSSAYSSTTIKVNSPIDTPLPAVVDRVPYKGCEAYYFQGIDDVHKCYLGNRSKTDEVPWPTPTSPYGATTVPSSDKMCPAGYYYYIDGDICIWGDPIYPGECPKSEVQPPNCKCPTNTGTYMNKGKPGKGCVPCPEGKTSTGGGPCTGEGILCAPAFSRDELYGRVQSNGDFTCKCPANNWPKKLEHDEDTIVCTSCGTGTSPEGSTSVNSCVCAAGSYLSGGGCVSCGGGGTSPGGQAGASSCMCPVDSYFTGTTCKSCGVGGTSPGGNIGLSSCTCTSGYYITRDGCVKIPDGSVPPGDEGCPVNHRAVLDNTNKIVACIPCGEGGTSGGGGVQTCICGNENSYYSRFKETCVTCPKGVLASGEGCDCNHYTRNGVTREVRNPLQSEPAITYNADTNQCICHEFVKGRQSRCANK